jgi:hypothetical protein
LGRPSFGTTNFPTGVFVNCWYLSAIGCLPCSLRHFAV